MLSEKLKAELKKRYEAKGNEKIKKELAAGILSKDKAKYLATLMQEAESKADKQCKQKQLCLQKCHVAAAWSAVAISLVALIISTIAFLK